MSRWGGRRADACRGEELDGCIEIVLGRVQVAIADHVAGVAHAGRRLDRPEQRESRIERRLARGKKQRTWSKRAPSSA